MLSVSRTVDLQFVDRQPGGPDAILSITPGRNFRIKQAIESAMSSTVISGQMIGLCITLR